MAGDLRGGPRRGEIWRYRFKAPDKHRPVVILTRQSVLPLLSTAMVAPITSTIRGLPSEVIVGVAEGLKHDSAVNLDNVHDEGDLPRPRPRNRLCVTRRLGGCGSNVEAGQGARDPEPVP